MSFEEPTRRLQAQSDAQGATDVRAPWGPAETPAEAPTMAMPGPLNLAGSAAPDETAEDTTGVLSLDELFDDGGTGPTAAADTTFADTAPADTAPADIAPADTAPAGADAPTWTAMPVVPVRSDASRVDAPALAGVGREPGSPSEHAPLGGRVRADAGAAWDGAVRRSREWLGRDDNGLMLATAVVAVLLILAVAAFA